METVNQKLESGIWKPENQAIITSIFSQKGGVGKTTTTINLADCLTGLGYRVLIIDIDPQGNASASLGIATWDLDRQLKDVLLNELTMSAVVRKIKDNLDMVPSNILLANQEIPISGQPGRETLLRKSLRSIQGEYDFIFIDCPPSVGVFSINALLASQYVLIPVDMSFLSLMGMQSIEQTLHLVRDSLEHEIEIIGILATLFDNRNNLTQEVYESLKKHFGKQMFETVIPQNVKLKEAPSFGKSGVDYAASSSGAKAYQALSQEFLNCVRLKINQKEEVLI